MHPERWKQVEDAFHRAQEMGDAERAAFLGALRATDSELCLEVESLLKADALEPFLEQPLAAETAPMFLDEVRGASRLAAGTRLGPYEILSPVASGGMGEIYRARDTRLDRNVAIKILPEHLAKSPELRERLEREARIISNLNHPNICTLHDVGTQDGIDFLVMEYLEGETLKKRLERGRLPLKEALNIAIQIADALSKTHGQGVVHRDLKPGNIMLVKSGAKLLDFGIASRIQPATSTAHNVSPSENGDPPDDALGGTLQYMAPEQLEGREGDTRTDIFALGTVIYEMCSGRKAFPEENQASLIRAISSSAPPPISLLQPAISPFLDHSVKICLAKTPEDRWQSIDDVLIQLKLIAHLEDHPVNAERKRPSRLRWAAVAALVLIVTAIAISSMVRARASNTRRISFEIPTPSAPAPYHIAISPDGTHVAAIVASNQGENVLWVRSMEHLNAQSLRGTEGASYPFWSPDGRFLSFFAQGELKSVDLLGAPPRTLCAAEAGRGGAWNKNDAIIFARSASGPLYRVSASGGIPSELTKLDASREETAHRHPQFLPDGEHFLYLAVSNKSENSALYIASLQSTERKLVVPTTLKGIFAAPDHLLYVRDGALVVQQFDVESFALKGEPVHISDDVGTSLATSSAAFSASADGILAYRSAGSESNSQLTWFDRSGKNIGVAGPVGSYESPTLSPDLQRIAVVKAERPASEIWIVDLVRGPFTRFTFSPNRESAPTWSPDGAQLVYASRQGGPSQDLYIASSNGAGKEELLLKSDSPTTPEDWSPDGRFLLFREDDPQTLSNLWVLPMTGDRTRQPVVRSQFRDIQGRFSPDGRWIAYVSNASGRDEVYVQPFPAGGVKTQISANGGYQPRWRKDGKELFFVSAAREVMAVNMDVSEGGTLKPGVPQKLFTVNPIFLVTHRNTWDVSPDGKRFLVNSSLTAPTVMPITILVNWLDK